MLVIHVESAVVNVHIAQLVNYYCSLSRKPENIDDDIVVFERILLAEIAIIFAVPEATCTHVEAPVALLEDDHVSREFKILVYLLKKLDDYFTGIVAPLLSFL